MASSCRPKPAMEDADPNTSEGLFVHASGTHLAAAQVGHVVIVKGAVAELVPTSDPASPSAHGVERSVHSSSTSASGCCRRHRTLTSAEVPDAGTLDQLERFEGMRVHAASLMAVSGTGADGAFYAVLTGQARPFREPGVESGHPVLPCAIGSVQRAALRRQPGAPARGFGRARRRDRG